MTAPVTPPAAFAEPHVWNKLCGDFILQARIEIKQGSPLTARMGWRAKNNALSLESWITPGNSAAWEIKRSSVPKGQNRQEQSIYGGDILQLMRRGSTWTFSIARNGDPFSVRMSFDAGEAEDVEAGLFFEGVAAEFQPTFRDIRVSRPARPDFRPYHDYIGARLEVLDVFTGELEVVHTSPEAFEAPNWMPDDRTLIVNISGPGPNKGTLQTFDLKSRATARLDTGFAVRNNNDHVLSLDAEQLAISHHSADDDGRSVIYKLPARGGAPVRVTPKSPSFLHGWSPDAQWLVYTGGRILEAGQSEKWDIYKIRSSGGEEVRLTSSPGLNDGPEFTPDGKYIYFNSTRSGLMQIWRMRADGSEQERVTYDEFNNWFPHISPDGKWIVFLSYGQDVAPAEHPYYRHVYVRLMPITGGPAKVIAYVYGGQGTINVPSWSPDSRRIAFVSNTDLL
jgi:Tol biopolymer transport system component